ncbi:MAG: hypothetical protein EOL88_00515 [Bacteroidia bacterium]|nr:hypothetical protein [Bacteroidia bacterium]
MLGENKKNLSIVIKAKDEATANLNKVKSGMGGLGSTALKLGAILGGTMGVVALGRKMIDLAGKFEQTQIAFTTMLGSAEQANLMLRDLADFASKTPFELVGIEQSAKQLLAMGIEANSVIPTMKALGDVSAGLSVDLNRLAYNYGQVKSQTVLTGVELRDFVRAGVPLISELAKNLNVSEKAIKDMVSEGKIGFPEVEKAFQTMSGEGGKFFDLMDKQSGTFLGKISNLKDSINIFLRTQGNMLITWGGLLVDELIKLADWLRADAEGFNYVGKTIYGVVQFFKLLWQSLRAIIDTFIGFGMTMYDVSKVMVAFVKDGINLFKDFGKNLMSVFSSIGKAITGDFSGAKEEISTMFTDMFSNVTLEMKNFGTNSSGTSDYVAGSWQKVVDTFNEFVAMEGMPGATTQLGEYNNALSGLSQGFDEATEDGKKATEQFKKFGETLEDFGEKSMEALNDVGSKIVEITDKMKELNTGYAKDTLGIRNDFAEAYVEQEQKVADLQAQWQSEKDQDHKDQLFSELEREKAVLAEKKSIELAYHNEVAEARRRASLTEFERTVEDLNLKRMAIEEEYQSKYNALQKELALEVAKYAEIKAYQEQGLKNYQAFLAESELATAESINREIEKYNQLAKAIQNSKKGLTTGQISVADINRRVAETSSQVRAIEINITGNTLLDNEAGEKIGNQIINKLQLANNL